MPPEFNIVVCCSGGGGNFKAILESPLLCDVKVKSLIIDRECGAVDVAQQFSVPVKMLNFSKSNSKIFEDFLDVVSNEIDLIVLAGFLPIIPSRICVQWKRKIINTHPSLLPKYGGIGMIGVRVQEAVQHAGEEYAGCSVHYVDEGVDSGEVIAQRRVKVIEGESAWDLGGRVFKEENLLLPQVIYELSKAKRESP